MAFVAKINSIRSEVNKKLHESNHLNNLLGKIEEKTGVDRFYIVVGSLFGFAVYLIFGYFAELLCNFIGFVYPAYASIKAIESSDKKDDIFWLTYWVVFALFNVIEFASDLILGWFPVYWLAKCSLMLYLYLPYTCGAQHVYEKFLRPFIMDHQSTIDKGIGKVAGRVGEVVDGNINY
ncbi:unnamed protein product [Soboliphyme baturini]|uniref:Receptor expression-enhancing protein n=1 Tax=Soboliphyme baturini TaxID=241478 RepID=A0A183IRF5_9BILA|nr:unnamed protein product [Soboliphyme baturini]